MDLGGKTHRTLENVQELRDLYRQAAKTVCHVVAVAITTDTLTRQPATAAHGTLAFLASLRFRVLDRSI